MQQLWDCYHALVPWTNGARRSSRQTSVLKKRDQMVNGFLKGKYHTPAIDDRTSGGRNAIHSRYQGESLRAEL